MRISKQISLGKNPTIEDNVIIGYIPGRKIKNLKVKIGDAARIRSSSVIYAGVKIGKDFETGHNVIIREENAIGNNFKIWNNSVIDYGCRIGNNVRIHNNVYVAQYTVIEDKVFLAPGVVITNDPHPICTKCMKGPIIKKNSRIGANVTLLPHIIIGESSLIGAGSVVTKNIPSHSVAYGNPARVTGKIEDLKCRFRKTRKPYKDGLDVFLRKEQ